MKFVFSHAAGFTIVEVLVTISVISIIYVLGATFIVDSLESQRYISEQNDAIVESRRALATMSAELREAVAADTGAYPLELLDVQEIIFYSDVDNDDYTEKIRYFLTGTELRRGVIEPTIDPTSLVLSYQLTDEVVETLASYIQNAAEPLFYYYNEDYPEDVVANPLVTPADPSEARLVRVHVLTNVDPNRLPDTREIDISIHLRNLKENF